MSTKRKNGDASDTVTGRERKKLKTAVARTIAVQQAGLRGNGEDHGQTGIAGPSRAVRFETVKPLPGSLDVEKFAEARAFEIDAMHTAIQNSREDATHRAWQHLPRHLRRRAASHDARRVPLRLRDKAKSEIDPTRQKTPKKSSSKLGRAKREARKGQFLKRQKDKVWLETHIWHAKRMKMENMWGYRLAVQPTEKSFRPSHRASVHGSILHDASYFGFIELKGPEKILRWIFESCCDMQGPSPNAQRFLSGARACDTHIYNPGSYPFDLVGPVTVIWQPSLPSPQINQPLAASNAPAEKAKAKNKGKGKATETQTPEPTRVVWIRVHPTIFDEVHLVLRTSASFALERVKVSADAQEDERCELEITDLRDRFNIFEITGPKSSQVIKGALKPVLEESRKEFKEFWDSLNRLQTTASVPRNLIAGFKVNDPRLSFPPHNAKVHIHGDLPTLSSSPAIFPNSVLAQCEIWDEKVRDGLKKPRFKKKELDARRSQAVIPGTPLQAQRQDDRIPIMLIQRSLESASWGSQHQGSSSPSLHGWTLIIPDGWSMAFFPSLIFTGTRVAGQRERQTQTFEAGCPHFPRDYPCTLAYEEFAADTELEERHRWERKPPAKRPSYQKLGTRSPWKPDWEVVLGLQPEGSTLNTGDYIPAQREEARQEEEQRIQPWLLRGVEVNTVLDATFSSRDRGVGLLGAINRLRVKRNQEPLGADVEPEKLLNSALVTVKVKMCGKGRPDDLALIYRLEDNEHQKWQRVQNNEREEPEPELSSLVPLSSHIIGYITTGNYSLSIGEGSAIGFVSVTQLFSLRQQAIRLDTTPKLLVKIRDREGTVCRAANIEVITT